jgi:site-specific DNA-methyltransferase (adenine-specific)
MDKLKIEYVNINSIKPYKKNPRKNKDAIPYVMESIKQFGFKNPVILDKDNVIIAGHTRIESAKRLGITEIPCIYADDLTDEQIKAFRLADNKVGEIAEWDIDLLDTELDDILNIDMSDFGFENIEIDWDNVEDLTTTNYDKPEHNMLECPQCHHIDRDIHFKKVKDIDIDKKELSDE